MTEALRSELAVSNHVISPVSEFRLIHASSFSFFLGCHHLFPSVDLFPRAPQGFARHLFLVINKL